MFLLAKRAVSHALKTLTCTMPSVGMADNSKRVEK